MLGGNNAGGSSVIGRQALERRPTSDLRSLFDYTPGVNFVGGSYNPLNEVEIRGMGSQSSDVMGNGANRVTMDLDGMEMSPGLSYGYYTRTGRQYFDPADLKEVEIEKGPGANGLSGSVRLRSKDPQDYLRDGANFGGEVRDGFNGENREFTSGASVAGRFDAPTAPPSATTATGSMSAKTAAVSTLTVRTAATTTPSAVTAIPSIANGFTSRTRRTNSPSPSSTTTWKATAANGSASALPAVARATSSTRTTPAPTAVMPSPCATTSAPPRRCLTR